MTAEPLDNGVYEIQTLDVDQADARVGIAENGEVILIDANTEKVADALDDVFAERETPRTTDGKIPIDHLVVTHLHNDHVKGVESLADSYEIQHVIEPDDDRYAVCDPDTGEPDGGVGENVIKTYANALDEHNVETISQVAMGADMVPNSNTTAPVLGPPNEDETVEVTRPTTGATVNFKDKQANENGVVFKIDADRSALFMGDVQDDTHHYAESWLIEQHDAEEIDLDADVLFVGHHGSVNATSEAFLDRVDPEVAVISSAFDGQYDHPHDDVLETLHEQDVDVFWTAVHGTVRTELDDVLTTSQTNEQTTIDAADLAALKHTETEVDIDPETVGTLAPEHLSEDAPDWIRDAPLIAETPEEIVEAAITNADTVEDVRQTLEEHPAAADHLETIVKTDREEHVTTPDDVDANRHKYAAAKQQANRTPTLIEQVRGTLPARFGGTNGATQTDNPSDVVDGPIKQTDLPRAVRTEQTAASQRAMGVPPDDHLLDAEQTADTAVENAENAGELCWGLRQTLGSHKDFLYASTTENAHETDGKLADNHTATKEATTDKHHDEDKGRGMGL